MRSIRTFALSIAALGVLVPAAQAGQIFSFQNPIPNGSYTNYMFETVDLFPGNTNPTSTFLNAYAGNVTLDVTNFSTTGAFTGSSSVAAKYYISNAAAPLVNSLFSGQITGPIYAANQGTVTFVDPADSSRTLLRIAFSKSSLAFGNFAAADTIAFSGLLLNTGETGNENMSFAFPNRYTLNGSQLSPLAHHTGTFTASIGRIGPVPEPAPLAGLALGGLALLRRRRRA